MELCEKLIAGKSIYLLEVRGELDLYGASNFREKVIDRIHHKSKKVLFDLTGLTYMDSSGVGAFIRILQELKKVKGHHRVINLKGAPRKVLELSNIISLINESSSKENASKALGELH